MATVTMYQLFIWSLCLLSQVLIVVTNACNVEKPISCPPYGQCCAMHEFCHETQRDCVSCFPSLYVTSESRLQFCQKFQFDSAIKMLHPSCVGACDALFGRKTFFDTAEKNILHTIAKSAPTTTTQFITLTTAAVDGSPGTDIVSEELTSANHNSESDDISISPAIFVAGVVIDIVFLLLLIALFLIAFFKPQIFKKCSKQRNENIPPELEALIKNSQNQDHQQMCKNCKEPLNGNTGQKQQDQINSHQNGDPKMICKESNEQNNENVRQEQKERTNSREDQDQNRNQDTKNEKNRKSNKPFDKDIGRKQQDHTNRPQNEGQDQEMICKESNKQNNENVRLEQKKRTNSLEDQDQNRNQETKNENDSSSQMKGPETLVSVRNAPKLREDIGDNASVRDCSVVISLGNDDDEGLLEATGGQDPYYQDQNKNQETKNENDSSSQMKGPETLVSVVRNTPKLSKDNGDNASVLGYSETSFGTDFDDRLSEATGGQDPYYVGDLTEFSEGTGGQDYSSIDDYRSNADLDSAELSGATGGQDSINKFHSNADLDSAGFPEKTEHE